MFARLRHLWPSSTPKMISTIVGHFAAEPASWPPPGSIRGGIGRGSQAAPLTAAQIAWIDARMPRVAEIAGQAAAAAAHSGASRTDRQGQLITAGGPGSNRMPLDTMTPAP